MYFFTFKFISIKPKMDLYETSYSKYLFFNSSQKLLEIFYSFIQGDSSLLSSLSLIYTH